MPKDLIDYSLPLMQAETALKRVYDKLLEQKPAHAMEYAHEAHRALLDAMVMIREELKRKQIST